MTAECLVVEKHMSGMEKFPDCAFCFLVIGSLEAFDDLHAQPLIALKDAFALNGHDFFNGNHSWNRRCLTNLIITDPKRNLVAMVGLLSSMSADLKGIILPEYMFTIDCEAYLRTIHPEDDSTLMEMIEPLIDEQLVTQKFVSRYPSHFRLVKDVLTRSLGLPKITCGVRATVLIDMIISFYSYAPEDANTLDALYLFLDEMIKSKNQIGWNIQDPDGMSLFHMFLSQLLVLLERIPVHLVKKGKVKVANIVKLAVHSGADPFLRPAKEIACTLPEIVAGVPIRNFCTGFRMELLRIFFDESHASPQSKLDSITHDKYRLVRLACSVDPRPYLSWFLKDQYQRLTDIRKGRGDSPNSC